MTMWRCDNDNDKDEYEKGKCDNDKMWSKYNARLWNVITKA